MIVGSARLIQTDMTFAGVPSSMGIYVYVPQFVKGSLEFWLLCLPGEIDADGSRDEGWGCNCDKAAPPGRRAAIVVELPG